MKYFVTFLHIKVEGFEKCANIAEFIFIQFNSSIQIAAYGL